MVWNINTQATNQKESELMMQNHECFEMVKSFAPGAVIDLMEKIRGGLPAKVISDKISKDIPLDLRQVISGAILHAGTIVHRGL